MYNIENKLASFFAAAILFCDFDFVTALSATNNEFVSFQLLM